MAYELPKTVLTFLVGFGSLPVMDRSLTIKDQEWTILRNGPILVIFVTVIARYSHELAKTYFLSVISVNFLKFINVMYFYFISNPIRRQLDPNLPFWPPKIIKMAISQNAILAKCQSPKSLLLLHFYVNLPEKKN